MTNNRFFPNGRQRIDTGNNEYKVKPGDIGPLFKRGLLLFSRESDGTKYIRITEAGKAVINKVNK